MHSPLEAITGRYEHAIFTTYSINLRFFEEWVMPLLRAAGVRNTIILADEAQLGVALGDRNLRSLGRSYHAVAVRLGPGAFHPKLILLNGDDGTRACVSSANLTVDGQLRNVEGAVALDSQKVDNLHALEAMNIFLRRIVETAAPPHTIEAALAALPNVEATTPPSHIRFVHNLDAPLLTHFPAADFTAVTPYADGGDAAAALQARGQLRIVTDANAFAAPADFFGNDWTVDGLDFDGRRLHGKAYWTSNGSSWLLIGSANLSRQALLTTAADANTEAGLVIAPQEEPLEDPPGVPASGEPLADTAPRRLAVEREAVRDAEATGSFNAWEDDAVIRVSGIADGITIDYWAEDSWHELGRVTASTIVPPLELRPYVIRAATGTSYLYAVVHRAEQLRIQRLRPRTTSRAADVVSTLPLDIAGVQALESVLKDLYLLAALQAGETEEAVRERSHGRQQDPEQETGGISEWVPARPDDEPRIPDIYRQRWQNAPDALLALIRSALRLDVPTPLDERDVLEESLDIDDADAQMESADEAFAGEEPPIPQVEERVLRRYQQSLNKLLERGAGFVRDVEEPALADLGFQAVLRLHERLNNFTVEVAGDQRELLPRRTLLAQKRALIDSYLRERASTDPLCLATARIHLADCLTDREEWTPLEWEQLETLAHRFSRMLLSANTHAQAAARDAEVELNDVDARLQPYADRTVWDGFYLEAENKYDLLDYGDQPFPWVLGDDWFDETTLSATWEIAGYAAVVGFSTDTSYAVVARNSDRTSKYQAHVLICEPHARALHEAFQRRIDNHWLTRTYTLVSEGTISNFRRIRSHALEEAGCPRSSLTDVDTPSGIVRDALAAAGLTPVSPL